jgi:Rps23 Pro-64 3,4-dihydroxylase Tpa1-like proline 4-hydroxylase
MEFASALNALYRYDAVIDQARASFRSGKPQVLLLTDFLAKPVYEALVKEVAKVKGREMYVPHEYRFEELSLPKVISNFFSSLHFRQFLTHIMGVKIKDIGLSVRRLSHQRFSLMYDDAESKERLVFFYTLAPADWKSTWGGSTIFSFGDNRAPATFEVKGNSLAIMKVPKGMRDFVKYVNHFAAKNSFVKIDGVLRF